MLSQSHDFFWTFILLENFIHTSFDKIYHFIYVCSAFITTYPPQIYVLCCLNSSCLFCAITMCMNVKWSAISWVFFEFLHLWRTFYKFLYFLWRSEITNDKVTSSCNSSKNRWPLVLVSLDYIIWSHHLKIAVQLVVGFGSQSSIHVWILAKLTLHRSCVSLPLWAHGCKDFAMSQKYWFAVVIQYPSILWYLRTLIRDEPWSLRRWV